MATVDYGLRNDGTRKSNGYFGVLKTTDGTNRDMTEFSVGVDFGMGEMEIPSIVPTLSHAELEHLKGGNDPTREIIDKAISHAKQRIESGKSQFWTEGDGVHGNPEPKANQRKNNNVEIKGVGTAQFPDDMGVEQIGAFLRRKYMNQTPLQNATKPVDTIAPYEPTLAEKGGRFIGDALYDSGIVSDRYGANRIGQNVTALGEFLPVIGDATAGDEFGQALAKGDKFGMGMSALGIIPVAGDVAQSAGRALQKNIDPADVSKIINDINVDVGSAEGFDKLTGELPIVNPNDLVGRTVVPTLADMTGAGGSGFKGIDSSEIMPIELQGGPGFPLLDSYNKNNIVWAVNDKGGLTKLQKGDIIAVSAMNPKAHRSNATVTQSFLSTLDSYVTDGRVSKGNLRKINSMIKSDKDFKGFPGLENQDSYHNWAEGLTFEKRSKFTKLLESSKAQGLGAPNFQKILDQTIDPKYAGYNQGDNMLLIEVDKTPDARVELGTEGTKKHRSYKYGVKGKVIGKFARPVSSKTLFPDFHAERRAAGADEGKDYRSFQLKLPSQTVTQDMADTIGNKPFKSIQSPRQARLTQDFLDDNWKDSHTAKKDGGVSVTDFAQALRNSDASATLTLYDPKDLNKGIREGNTAIHQLGDSEIYFALKDNYDYNAEYGVDLASAGLTPYEKAVVGVVNNEKGAKGVAGTSVMLKALEEGATVLDAFSVKSAKFPNGFLPSLYGKYGFQEVAKVPFEPKYYSKLELKDLEKTWSESGWDKSQGYPDVSVMKWKGDDSARQTIKQDWLNAIKTGDVPSAFGQPKAEFIANAEEAFSEYGGATADGVRGAGNASNDTRSIRVGDGTPDSRGFAGVVNELQGLTGPERSGLGLPLKGLVDDSHKWKD